MRLIRGMKLGAVADAGSVVGTGRPTQVATIKQGKINK
jgi:hypothetical protein